MLTLEQAKQIIQTKYGQVGASILGNFDINKTTSAADNTFYCFTDKAVLVLKEENGCHYILTTPGFFTTYFTGKLCTGLGVPVEDPKVNPDGQGKRQKFTKGQIYWHPNTIKPRIIKDGDFWKKYAEMGWEKGPLGYPTSDATSFLADIPNLIAEQQTFQNGVIMVFQNKKTKERFCFAFTKDGLAYPKRNYSLMLQNVKCIRESKGLGSDELGISVITTPSNGDSSVYRWFNGDVDSGENFAVNKTLYSGKLPMTLNMSLAGFEKDGPKAFNDAKAHFEKTLIALDDDFDREIFTDRSEITGLSFIALGTILGKLIAGGGLTLINGTLVVTGAAAAGGLIAGAVAIVLLAVIGIALAWRHPELLMLSRNTYLGDLMAAYILGGMPPSAPIVFSENGVDVEITYKKESANSMLETRTYRNRAEKSHYELTFIHSLKA